MAKSNPNVTFHHIGLAEDTDDYYFFEDLDQNVEMMTFEDILQLFGDTDKEITYLKIDIEGHELPAIRRWALKSGAFKNVQQFGIEIHLTKSVKYNENMWKRTYKSLIKAMQKWYRQGLKLISYSPNGCVHTRLDTEEKYHSLFDLVFVRE